MVSAPEDREPNVQWTFGERQRGETPMEVFPRGTLVLVFWLKFRTFFTNYFLQIGEGKHLLIHKRRRKL